MNFHDRFLALLNEHDLTTYRLCRETGLGETLLGYWRRGERKPTMDNLIKLADYFGVSIDYLVGRTDKPEVNK